MNCKNCTMWKTCDIKQKPPTDCRRYQNFMGANSPITKEIKEFDEWDKEIRSNKAVDGPL